MTQISMTVNGAEIVRQGLQDLGAEVPKIGRLGIYRATQAIVRTMKTYPPERVNQRYRRTGGFGQSWEIIPKDNGYTVKSNYGAAKYVVGNAYGLEQAWMHVSTDQGKRWNILREVVEDEVNQLPPAIAEEIEMVARRSGFK